jgi:hypothetical protein
MEFMTLLVQALKHEGPETLLPLLLLLLLLQGRATAARQQLWAESCSMSLNTWPCVVAVVSTHGQVPVAVASGRHSGTR